MPDLESLWMEANMSKVLRLTFATDCTSADEVTWAPFY